METSSPKSELKQLGLDRLYYLRDVVFPYLDKMPTIEDVTDTAELLDRIRNPYGTPIEDGEIEFHSVTNGRRKQGKAVLDFNIYCQNNTPWGFDLLPSSHKYDCSRQGCLAGWYTFMRDQDKSLSEPIMKGIASYSIFALSSHFKIPGGAAQMLFGPLLSGAEGIPDEIDQEQTLWSTSQLNVTKIALEERRVYLNKVIQEMEEGEDEDDT